MEQQIVSDLKQVQFDFHLLCCSYKGWSLHSARKQAIILGLSLTPKPLPYNYQHSPNCLLLSPTYPNYLEPR